MMKRGDSPAGEGTRRRGRRRMTTTASTTTTTPTYDESNNNNKRKQEVVEDKYVITKEEIESMDGTQKTHFLNSNAKRVNKSLGDLTGLKNIGFHIIEIEPGGYDSTELHVHYNEEECLYILQGEAIATIGYNNDDEGSKEETTNDGRNETNDGSSNTNTRSSSTSSATERRIHVKAGDFIGYRAGGLPHKLTSTGSTTLKCIVVGQRLDMDIADYPSKNLRLYRSSGGDNNNENGLQEWNLVPIDSIRVLPTGSGSTIGKK